MNSSDARSRRTFIGERLLSYAGYLFPPVMLDALCFFLPPFQMVSSRVVLWKKRVWEFWSPNSPRMPYYPGVRDPQMNFGHNQPPHLRRCDGHLGRFDPTVSPQHFDPARPWQGFIRRCSDESRPEYRSFLLVWQLSSPPNSGSIKPSFIVELRDRVALALVKVESWSALEKIRPDLWLKRVRHPNVGDVNRLEEVSDFESALDLCTRIQRGIKSLTAWSRMASTIVTDFRQPAGILGRVAPADDSMMGVWLNGCSEKEGTWLLRHRVPCFIVHEAIGLNDVREALARVANAPKTNFVMDTLASSLHSSVNPIDMAVLLNGGRLVDIEIDIGLGRLPDTSVEDRERSSAFRQGWFGGRYVGHLSVPGPISRFAGPTVIQVNGRIIPPPVIEAKPAGSWSRWNEESSEESGAYLQIRGKNNRDLHGDHKYYDRQYKRWLYLEQPLAIPSHYDADPQVFGLPAPVARYVEMENNTSLAERRASMWVYYKERPARIDVGRVYIPPAPAPPLPPALPPPPPPAAPLLAAPALAAPAPAPICVSVAASAAGSSLFRSRRTIRSTASSSRHRSRSPSPMDVDILNQEPCRRSPSPPARPSSRFSRNRHYSPPRRSRSPVLYPRRSSPRFESPRRRSYPPVRSRGCYSQSLSPEERHGRRSPSPSRRLHSHYPSSSRGRSLLSQSPRSAMSTIRGRSPAQLQRDSGSSDASSRSTRHSRRTTPSRSLSPSPSHRRSLLSRSPSQSSAGQLSLSRRLRSSAQEHAALSPAPNRSLLDLLDGPSVDAFASPMKLDMERLGSLFPPPTSPGIPVLKKIGSRAQGSETRYLMIWNLPVCYVWVDVVAWIESLPIRLETVQRVLRTNQDSFQFFWFVFDSVESAERFRGIVSGRCTEDTPDLKCDFVDQRQYSSASGHSVDAWRPVHGFENDIDTTQPFGGNIPSRIGPGPPDIKKRKRQHRPREIVVSPLSNVIFAATDGPKTGQNPITRLSPLPTFSTPKSLEP
ncbi:hypothetical protein BDZ97DRAFT_1932663 [Flammula alnicola]|nr:hypothetical protein BDZ97DRAFT_1932663 [Flammula alnicola]